MGMRRRAIAANSDEAAAARFAWWAAFFATLTLIAVLGIAKSAQAFTVPSAGSPGVVAALAPPPADQFEDEAEASEGDEFEDEECDGDEEDCEEEGEGEAKAPAECLLTSAQPTVLASGAHDKVRLQLRYTTSSPTTIAVEYGLHGGKGSLFLGGEKKHLGEQGVLHLSKGLSEAQMAKVMAAKGFTVRLRVPDAPGYCKAFFEYQLNSRQTTPSGLAWHLARVLSPAS